MATVELRYSPKDTAWFTANATMVLKAGEPAYHETTGLFKLGDGTTQLSALPFLPAGGGGGGNFVPYTGATGDVDLGEYELKAGQIELDQTPTGTASVAVTRWNDTNGLTETTLKGGSVIIKNGIDLVARVVNKVTPNATLTKAQYQVVKISGAQGQRLAVGLAQANNDNNSADTLGVAIETITTNQEGFIMCVGVIENINTTGSLQGETWADGDVLYLSPTTAGAITKVKPNGSTGHIVVIGYVEYAHANNGKIYVKIMNGWELDELHNVYINAPANNEVLTYESATSLWKNKTVVSALGYTPYNSTNPSGYISSITSGNVTTALGYIPANQTDLDNKGYNITLSSTTSAFSPADNTTYYFGSARIPSVTSKDNSIIISKTGTIKQIGIVTIINTTLSTTEDSILSVRVRSGGINGAITDTVVTSTLKFNLAYISTLVTGLNISVTAGDAIEMKWLTPTWVTNPVNIFINTNLFIA